jgi:pseudaminic acid synthase
MTIEPIKVGNNIIGFGHPTFIIAEMSANHGQSFDQAIKIVISAKEVGADAIKLQTYTPDTLTINCDSEYFSIGSGTIWEGKYLYDLYGEAYTPWDWQPKLKQVAEELGLACFSTPFDLSAIDFLKRMNVPAYKIASFELIDLQLIQEVARTGAPMIISTGMASLAEIDEAVRSFHDAGGTQLALLKCTSAYPSPPEDMNLRTIPHLAEMFRVPVGLSDHTLGIAVPVAAVAMGACIIEKHFTLSRAFPGPDSEFSLEPHEFKAMVEAIRTVEKARGTVSYEISEKERASRIFRRSLFVIKDIKSGELFTEHNVRSIRPSYGLPPKYISTVLGRHALRDIMRGTPLSWDLVG